MQIRVTAPLFEYGCVQFLKGEITHVGDELGNRLLKTGAFELVPEKEHVPMPLVTLPHAETAVRTRPENATLPRTVSKPKPPAKPKGK